MKAQMFVVTAIFLTSMMFFVQEMMITYSMFDISGPFNTKESYIIENTINSVNETIKGQPASGNQLYDCQQVDKNLQELLSEIRDDVALEGYFMDADYNINGCDMGRWNNVYPDDAPLQLSLRISGVYDSEGIIDFYRYPLT